MTKTVFEFDISTEEDLYFANNFSNRGLVGRILQINVLDAKSGKHKVTLTGPHQITLVPPGRVVVHLPKDSMKGWMPGEYEADLLDITSGRAMRIMANRFTYAEPGRLKYGARPNEATVTFTDNEAVITALGSIGPPGPATEMSFGSLVMLEPGQDPVIWFTGEAPFQQIHLKIPPVYIPQQEELLAQTTEQKNLAMAAQQGAQAAQTAAETARNQTISHQNSTELLRDAAQASANTASTKATEAAGSAAQALTSRQAADAAKTASETARTAAQTARTGAETARDAASGSATTAGQHKDAALVSRDAAEGFRNEAEASKTAAATSKTGADSSRDAAQGSATAAATSATNAAASETNAASSKTAAATSATSAGTAKTAAETANTNAQAALTAANTAKTGAEAAKVGADTAKAGADTAKAGAETARDAALAHRNDANVYQGWALDYRNTALTYRNEAETFRDQAAASAEAVGQFDPSTFYTKVDSDARFAPVVHAHAIADITGLQTALNGKAPLASPALTGTPTAPTAAAGTNTTQVATTAFIKTAIDNLVSAAPGSLDTLNELAAALGDDPNFATTVSGQIGTKAPLASPELTGTPTAPTPATADNTTKLATTAHVQANAALKANLTGANFTGGVGTPSLDITGATSGINIHDRTNPAKFWTICAEASALQIYYYDGATQVLLGQIDIAGLLKTKDFGVL